MPQWNGLWIASLSLARPLTRGRLFLHVAFILSADAGGARLVDVVARLEGEALVVARVVGEPLAALGFLKKRGREAGREKGRGCPPRG